jgi:Ni2+-binding GTPase involved in maturation of urease and hydrogenase
MMELHLIGGFLGSGKTTAIIHAAKALMDQGKTVGVVTNDQGKYLVDTAFFRLADIPAVEVTGGCFCCNYDDLDSRLTQVIERTHPDVIFAESVGSCADVVATVVRPLMELHPDGAKPSSFSVFTDGRLLRRYLLGEEMPFSRDVVYIFEKQIEEAGLVVINKIDLLSPMALEETQALMNERFPNKAPLPQDSRSIGGIKPWLDRIQSGAAGTGQAGLEIDYARYGAGEARLAWLDMQVQVGFAPGEGQQALRRIITGVVEALHRKGAGIGHLKWIVQETLSDGAGAFGEKISIPAYEEPGWEMHIPAPAGDTVLLLINVRVEMPAEALRGLIHEQLAASGAKINVREEMAFHPAQPKPTHRYTE